MRDSALNFNVLHRTCTLVVLLCFVHISVTIFYYVRSLDLSASFVQNQQSRSLKQSQPRFNTVFKEARADATETKPVFIFNAAAKDVKELEQCPDPSPILVGPLRIEFSSSVSLDLVRAENPNVQEGGRFRPRDCVALQKVAIIIPFRNRAEHLKFWLYYLHPILQRQQLDYGVYIINQIAYANISAECILAPDDRLSVRTGRLKRAEDGDEVFNRAKLLNVGYTEALKDYDYDCFIFSDVDLIPMDDRNTYKCFSQPRHLSVSMDKFGFRLPYNQYFGGVSSMSKQQFLKINGFPNNYWGWGGEDDDIYNRLSSKGMSISRPSGAIGKCRMIRHDRDKQNDPNPQRFDRIAHTRETMNRDGINSLSYKVIRVERDQLYTKITVDVGKRFM